MDNKILTNRIKQIISEGKSLEACSHIDLLINKNSECYNRFIVIKNILIRIFDESLLNIIPDDQKNIRLNQANYRLLQFLSSLTNADCHSIIQTDKTKEEILEELLAKNKEIEFAKNQLKAIHDQEIIEKNQIIKDMQNRFKEEKTELKIQIGKLNESIKIHYFTTINYQNEIKELQNKLEQSYKERDRLKEVIKKEYSDKKLKS